MTAKRIENFPQTNQIKQEKVHSVKFLFFFWPNRSIRESDPRTLCDWNALSEANGNLIWAVLKGQLQTERM